MVPTALLVLFPVHTHSIPAVKQKHNCQYTIYKLYEMSYSSNKKTSVLVKVFQKYVEQNNENRKKQVKKVRKKKIRRIKSEGRKAKKKGGTKKQRKQF